MLRKTILIYNVHEDGCSHKVKKMAANIMSKKIEATKLLICNVGNWVHYQDAAGEEKQMARAVVCDESRGLQYLWAYDEGCHAQYLRAGYSLKVRNTLERKEGLVITKYTKLMLYR